MAKRGPKTDADLRAELDGGAAVSTPPSSTPPITDPIPETPAATETAIPDTAPAIPPVTPLATDLEDDVDSSKPGATVSAARMTISESDALAEIDELAYHLANHVAAINTYVAILGKAAGDLRDGDAHLLKPGAASTEAFADAVVAHVGPWCAGATVEDVYRWRDEFAPGAARLREALAAHEKAGRAMLAAVESMGRRRFELANRVLLPLAEKR